MANELTKEDILRYFDVLNEHLKARGINGEIIMCGGASLSCIYNARNSTHDIDAVFEPAKDFREIIKQIADDHNLTDDWLNDGVKGFLSSNMTSTIYKEYSNLSVRSIDADGLLALKLTSARLFSTDKQDSICLMKHLGVQSEQEMFDIVDKYIPKRQQSLRSYYFSKEAFQEYSEKGIEKKSISQRKDLYSQKAQKTKRDREKPDRER